MNSEPGVMDGEPIAAVNWLDRLRSNKGFPLPNANLGLDHFLRNCDDHRSLSTDESTQWSENRHSDKRTRVREKGLPQWTEIQCILSDLFNVGSGRRVRPGTLKAGRKQANPRCFQSTVGAAVGDSSSRCLPKDEAALASTVSLNSGADVVVDTRGEEDEDGGAGEESGWRGYSRSEVTVIDTSCEGWKFNKVLYRKKDIWKVRDIKGRSNSSGGVVLKKRKAEITANEDQKKKKKQKLKHTDHSQGPSEIALAKNNL